MEAGKPLGPSPSPLVERLHGAIEKWAENLAPHLRESFRQEFGLFGNEHDRMVSTIESIWKRRDRRLDLDDSTGVARRRPFLDHLSVVVARAESPLLRAVAVLFIDIDNFKRINDTFGHEAGDKALSAVGRILRETIRAERDIDFTERFAADDDHYSVSRHGGDEFLAALKLDDPSGVDVIAPRIKQRVDDPETQKANGYTAPVPMTASVGGVVYELPLRAPTVPANTLARQLIAAADELMYAAKRDGRIHIANARFTDRLEVDRGSARTLAS